MKQEAQEALVVILSGNPDRFGHDGNGFERALADATKGSTPGEVTVLVNAFRLRVHKDIQSRDPELPTASLRRKLVRRLMEYFAHRQEAAEFAVDTWAHALAVELDASPIPAAPPKPTKSSSHGTRTLVRVARYGADARSIAAALKLAAEGATIVLGPGEYTESIEITARNVSFRGEGEAKDTIWKGALGPPLVVNSATVTLEAISLRGPGGKQSALQQTNGTVHFRDCDVRAEAAEAIQVAGAKAELRISRTRVHRSGRGLNAYEGAAVIIEQATFEDHAQDGILLESATAKASGLTVRRCGKQGIYCWNGGASIFENCVIQSNGASGVRIGKGSAPTFRFCKIKNNGEFGVVAARGSGGLVESSDLRGNQEGPYRDNPKSPVKFVKNTL